MKLAKKICLIGRFGVGKTSLVKQYIDKQFSEKYKTTVGVSISTKSLLLDDIELSLVIWDIAGFEHDGHYNHYLRGVHGLIWVIDGTEPESFSILDTMTHSLPQLKQIPSICFINKHDLISDWIIGNNEIDILTKNHHLVLNSSAKTGKNVELGFQTLAKLLLNQHD